MREIPEWQEALMQYTSVRQAVGELEEQCDGSCLDAENFYICELCKDRRNFEYRMESLMRTWGETWAIQLAVSLEEKPCTA